MMELKEPERDAKYYGVSQEYFDKIRAWNRTGSSAQHKDMLEKLDDYHLSANLNGRKRIQSVKSVMKELGTSFDGKRFVDLGCGTGGCLIAASQEGAAYIEGWEIVESKINFAKVNIRAFSKGDAPLIVVERYMDDLANGDDPAEPFDIVLCDHVLEHVKNLDNSVATIVRLIEPELGLGFIRVPNGYCAQSVISDPHLNIFGLALLDRLKGAPLAKAIKNHGHYDTMFGEFRRYHEYKSLFQEHGLQMMPLHSLALEREGVRDVQYKISQIKRLRDEQLPEWRGKVPGETLDLLSDRLKEYLQEADSRLNEVKRNFEHDDLLVSLLTDYRLYDLNFLVFHPRNKMVG